MIRLLFRIDKMQERGSKLKNKCAMDWIIKDLNKQLSSVNYGIENDTMTDKMRVGHITKRRELIAAILILESAEANIPSVKKQMNYDRVLAAGDSLKTDEFRIHLTEPDELKIVATGVGFDNIRIEPVSANCIIVHACS